MATLTYNPNEQAEGELSTEEQEALEVGEKLAEQQSELLAGKFKDAEELEKGYIALQKKLGSQEEEVKEEVKVIEEPVEEGIEVPTPIEAPVEAPVEEAPIELPKSEEVVD